MAPKRRRVIVTLGAAALLVVVPSLVAFALFSATSARAGGVIINGNLQLTAGSSVNWAETTAAISSAQRQSGSSFASLATYVGVPGDTLEVRYPVTTTLAGDNISAIVRVSQATLPQPLPPGVTVGGYRVLDGAGSVVAPLSGYNTLGSATVISSLTSAGAKSFVVAVQISWGAGAAPSYTSDLSAGGGAPPTLTVVPIAIALEQVRAGAGFVP